MMKESKNFSISNVVLIIFILFASIYLINNNLTNSKYVSELSGNGSLSSSNWNISLKYNNTSQSDTYNIPINFSVIPGSTTDFPVTIDSTECDTSLPIKYDIKIEPVSTSIPDNINFYIEDENNTLLDSTYTGEMQGGLSKNLLINFKWALTDKNEDEFQGIPLKFNLKVQVYSSI